METVEQVNFGKDEKDKQIGLSLISSRNFIKDKGNMANIKISRPMHYLAEVAKKYPGMWELYEDIIRNKGKSIPDWDNRCFVPTQYALDIAVQYGKTFSNVQFKGIGSGNIENQYLCTYAMMIATLAAWRVGLGIYQIDDDVLDSLISSDIEYMSADVLLRLPEWSIYVPTDGHLEDECGKIMGFWATLAGPTHTFLAG